MLLTGDAYMARAADINQDGKFDIYVVRDGQDTVLMNDCVALSPTCKTADFVSLTVSDSPDTSAFGGNVSFANLDNDANNSQDAVVSDIDIEVADATRFMAILRTTSDPVQPVGFVLIEDPDCAINPSTCRNSWVTQGTYDSAILDINGDLNLDILAGTVAGLTALIQGEAMVPAVSMWESIGTHGLGVGDAKVAIASDGTTS